MGNSAPEALLGPSIALQTLGVGMGASQPNSRESKEKKRKKTMENDMKTGFVCMGLYEIFSRAQSL